jgi:aspartyl-tRNA(Asn)/glutamyl-tRNA(Gln) amidotransferase subunit B
MHLEGETDTVVDYNRAGVPLIEIVTEPVIQTAEEARAFLTEVRKLVRYLEICDGNMEEGSLRCDANISVKLKGIAELGKKVEIKNMNSIRNVQHAIEHEVDRQIELLEKGELVISETRTFDVASGTTAAMRTKEELNDYRYFPDPDVSPLEVSNQWLQAITDSMPLLPYQYVEKFEKEYGLPVYDAQILTESKEIAYYFDSLCGHINNYKVASNWMMGVVKAYLNDHAVIPIPEKVLSELIGLVEEGLVSHSAATQRIFPYLCEHPDQKPVEVARNMDVIQARDAASILPIIENILSDFPQKVVEYKKGKKGIMGMFMGEVMKRSNGKADPKLTSVLLAEKLNEK